MEEHIVETTEITSLFGYATSDPKLIAFHETRNSPRKVVCIKDSPSGTYIDYHDFKKGDEVEIKGLVGRADGRFEICIPSVVGFYDPDHFELID